MSIKYKGQSISGSPGKNATINGQNTLEIVAGENITIEQTDSVLTINASGGTNTPIIQTLNIITPPDKVSYITGDVFDPTGMEVTAIYEGGFFRNLMDYTITPDGPLEEGVDKVTVSYTENDVTVTAEQPISVTSIHIYGVTWDGTSTTKWTRTDEASLFTDPVPYIAGATEYGSPFDNLMPWAGMVKEKRTGGTMVAIPKFWYKLEQNTPGTPSSGLSIKIANLPLEGFSVSPAHMDRGDGKGERDVVYVGRYHCGDGYKSITGALPISNIIRPTARAEIHKLNANIWQTDFVMRFTIWLLYLVEFADWDSQKVIGRGCGNGSSIQAMGYTDTMPYHTGTTQSSRDVYGIGTQYRNIEGMWDNVYDWCDGCYSSSNGFMIILNPNNFNESGGVSIGTPVGYRVSAFTISSNAGFTMFYPIEGSYNANSGILDDWFFEINNPAVVTGGCYQQYPNFGMFCVNRAAFTYTEATIGSRIQELP